ncbi:hypothetical protein GGQ74_002666 [Desulfobaculum xiamenense]|uniref:Uncharacterized protein n=1 Tax=Desulfobaculum xiamenense TaxID=995050 RepID=A0A846QR62_9BACT|nr:hypothetical protein [Desulfobaculum xiamenense]NJB68972.1 hypothetical protein [Desulfobaculum xiamenense]
MAIINSYVSLSRLTGVNHRRFDELGIFDPLLTADTPLFIDPLLLKYSSHELIQNNAREAFEKHFKGVLALMRKIQRPGDVYFKSAVKNLQFPEVKGICLGVGGATVEGRGAGKKLTKQLFEATYEIAKAGYEDPYLFSLMAVLDAGYGPDRISDMTANVIEEVLCRFTEDMCGKLQLPTDVHESSCGNRYTLPTNPFTKDNSRILLVPLDILRKIPIATDWESAMDAAAEVDEIRNRVNKYIGDIFYAKTKKDKRLAFEIAQKRIKTNAEAFSAAMDMFNAIEKSPYDYKDDPEGFIVWRRSIDKITDEIKTGDFKKVKTEEDAFNVVSKIIERFQFWIEDRRISTELWDSKGNPRKEKTSQKLFFMVADEICRIHDLDISPETDSGGGPVDFKFSKGHGNRVVVEIKLSTNSKVVTGLTNQLEAYRTAEDAKAAFYVVIDVGKMATKEKKLAKAKNDFNFMGKRPTELVIIDGIPKKSASKL